MTTHFGFEARFIDYYESNDVGLDTHIKAVLEKPYTYGQHYGPHDLNLPYSRD